MTFRASNCRYIHSSSFYNKLQNWRTSGRACSLCGAPFPLCCFPFHCALDAGTYMLYAEEMNSKDPYRMNCANVSLVACDDA